MYQNILITGGAGFIGSNLALKLQKDYPNSKILVLDDFSSANFKNLKGFKGIVYSCDVSTDELFFKVEDFKPDVIFHLASITDTTVTDQEYMMRRNVDGFKNILEFAYDNECIVVYASSASVYGNVKEHVPLKEDREKSPENVYAFSKYIMDNLAQEFSDKTGLKIVGVRYFNVYGPREAHKGKFASMIYQLYLQMKQGNRPRIFKWGEQKRDFVYVKDAVDATILAAKAPKSTVYNVGSGEATSFNDVIKYLNQALGTNLEPEYFDCPYDFYQEYTQADMTKIKEELGFVPRYSIQRGIKEYVDILEGRIND
ncbi:MAG TPA: ADP-glyceromanno-heptose 6-epimerase [Sulfurihydrogenibium sp.]|uniref:ADP-glyceromanno-heptose 6-epimerase n=1 Tax=Sulfurihydrogenibium sp. (strain YO3AOP1) TaxID=436114 RepID=UPI0001722E92|nr:ADP-glyceromanno-heptose 6-epimerase [Sulfurihydrogenibium sp. YO3AOP1]ACD66682.1 ADP-L-glycero-D-manno-heptose-6-epimerase [Sulfurihydrogenibium sp. YO3AOP1]HBT98287.1 ADP-glyceromanno-heptose 6-epimerase [Sulfurihydrogenibium sp.]